VKKIGRYEILAEIAEGGMAVVYAGRPEDGKAPQLVALKVIRSQHAGDDTFVKMFIDEARISSRLVHPNIIRTHELGRDGKHHFLAMELVLGQTLARFEDTARARGVTIPFEVAAYIGARLADGLHYAHDLEDRNIVHRDVNPSNVIVTYDGRAKLIDFGLARAVDRIASTTHGVVKGKLAYLAPEQAQGKTVDRRADVFALGVTLWELTTGQRLFKAESDVATVQRVLTTDAPDPTTVVKGYPPELAKAIMRALSRDVDRRWQTARELQTALDAFVGGKVDDATVARLVARVFPADRKREAWEEAIESVARNAARRDGFLAWDDDEKKMTWFQLEGGTREMVSFDNAALDALLARRASSDDAVTASRARLEQAAGAELAGDLEGAAKHARAALEADARATGAHWLARRVLHDRARPRAELEHLGAEIAAGTEESRADLLAERARLLAAAGENAAAVRDEHERALSLRATHAAALAGLEDVLEGVALAKHLAREAAAFADKDPKLAAWLHVERGRLLDAAGEAAAAADAMRAALALDGGLGPVRDACVQRAVVQKDARALVSLLDAESTLEKDGARAAALECDAACIARANGDDARALALITRAAARGATGPLQRRIVDALVEIHETAQNWGSARTARAARVVLHATPAERAAELRASSIAAERAGDAKNALADLEAAHALDPADARTTAELDRMLGDVQRREALWAAHAARSADGSVRARALVRAADLAANGGRSAQAVGYLRDALAATPDDPDVLERLAVALPGSREADADVRARAAVYERAAERAEDDATRVAWLERLALVYEEIAGDVALARRAWDAVRAIEPERRSALMGAQRVAARAGDAAALAAALQEEAKVVDKPRAARLRLRAARALAANDPDRALQLCKGASGLELATEIHARAGRWTEAAAAIEKRARDAEGRAKATLLVELAEIQRARLGAPAEALESLRAARTVAPDAPIAEEIAAIATAQADPKLLREVMGELAATAATAIDRVRFSVRAAEIDELVGDDESADAAYGSALEAAPDDAWLTARRARVRARLARKESDDDKQRAEIEAALAVDPKSIPTLRAQAALAKRTGKDPLLANALEAQIGAVHGDLARLVALWKEAFLVEWRLPESGAFDVYERILAVGPDRAALDALVRRTLPRAREDEKARDAALRGLDAQQAIAPDASSRLLIALESAALTDARGDRAGALARYRAALAIDARSPTAAMHAARLGEMLRESDAMVEASCALADLASDGVARAALLVRAGGTLATRSDDAARDRAATLLEGALEADPTSAPAAGALVALLQDRDKRRLVSALRAALDKTKQPETVLMLATEIARAARGDVDALPLVVSALERAKEAAPTHAPTWFALAEVSAAQSAWPDAIRAYEAASEHSRDPGAKKRALVSLAEVHHRIGDAAAALAVLRRICDLDPKDTAAHRALVDALRALPFDERTRAEIGQRLERLAGAESTPDARGKAWMDLASLRKSLGDRTGTEQAFSRAVAESPTPENLARLAATYGAPPAGPRDHARVLEQVLARAAEIGRPSGAIFGALAALEVGPLGRTKEGVAHARAAIGLSPKDWEARAALASGLAQLGEHAEAVTIALPMFESPESVASLAKLDAFMDVLETSLHSAGRAQEALVARELRAIGGAMGEAALVTLRARRLPDVRDAAGALSRPIVLQRVMPASGRSLALDIAAAVAPIMGPFFPSEVEGATRGNVNASHPLFAPFRRAASLLAVEGAELAVSDALYVPRATVSSVPLVVVPASLAKAPEPVRVAAIVRALCRLQLGAPWIDRARVDRARAVLVAGARLVVPTFGTSNDRAQEALVAEYAKPVAKAIGRAQKKALSALEPRLAQSGATISVDDLTTLVKRVGQAELSVAFLVTGDLVGTLDDLRASDGDYARAARELGPAALVATLRHPLAGEAVRFALSETATDLRRAIGTLWKS
jgi:serine/threonine-protein kinase